MIDQLLHFTTNHWLLCSALVVVIILLIVEEAKQSSQGGNRLSAAEVTQMMNRERAQVIDLRDAAAFSQGHILGALNFPQADIANNMPKIKKLKAKLVILVDNSGLQTSASVRQLKKEGFEKVYCLAGGLQAWLKAGLPVTKTK